MTSRKALGRLKSISIYEDMSPNNPCNDLIEYKGDLNKCYKEEINTIEKNLDVLDILKKYISIQMFDIMEPDEKIKVLEWLENE